MFYGTSPIFFHPGLPFKFTQGQDKSGSMTASAINKVMTKKGGAVAERSNALLVRENLTTIKRALVSPALGKL